MNENINSYYLFKNHEVAVVTKAKVASRFTHTAFSEYYNSNDNSQYIYLNREGEIQNSISDESYFNYKNLNTDNVDVYFFYRNPEKRYYSGIIQDLLRILNVNAAEYNLTQLNYAFYLSSYFKKFKLNPFEMMYHFAANNYSFMVKEKKYIEFIKSLIKNYIEWQLNFKPTVTEHIETYISPMYSMSNKINQDKVFYVNIDKIENNIGNILSKYESLNLNHNSTVISESLRPFYYLVNEVFNENPKYLKIKDIYVADEIPHYDILESHERNILNLR